MTEPPQRVMHFYRKIEYALECIAFKQITLSHVDESNDPFDPYFYFETDFSGDYQAIINHVQKHHEKSLQQFKQILPKENWESFINGIEEDYFKNLRDSAFIFSTCEVKEDKHPKDNLYMWSHYGNGHRGIGIEFDTTLLAMSVLEEQKRLDGKSIDPWFEINYQYEVPKITCEHIFQHIMSWANNDDGEALEQTELANTLRLIFRTKSMIWKEEEEWHLMKQNDETKLNILRLNIMDDVITSVYLGCRFDENKNDAFIYETNRNFPKAEIFKARQRKGEFALDFERIAGTNSAKT